MNKIVIIFAIYSILILIFLSSSLDAAPAPQNAEAIKVQNYSPFSYQYKVEDAEKKLYHDKSESGDENGKVTGKYSVLMPDGRLMVVEYLASLETGFVPKISFVDNANPFTG
ncbi:hypothetical protein PVAND_009808 [Polypedilum vanderplanki]|uniref:Cuticle protein n=1 Tax=Polypedilum vanderplanki TaxID=319348 RepID=A0A9J6CDY1_POLVA|nr:hypothetical protein PVAND_009808 [Polypedilum vanderplanki]